MGGQYYLLKPDWLNLIVFSGNEKLQPGKQLWAYTSCEIGKFD
jgi:hypothetical protein